MQLPPVSSRYALINRKIAGHLLAYGRSFETNQVPHVVGAAAEEVAELAGREVHADPELALELTRLLAHSCRQQQNGGADRGSP